MAIMSYMLLIVGLIACPFLVSGDLASCDMVVNDKQQPTSQCKTTLSNSGSELSCLCAGANSTQPQADMTFTPATNNPNFFFAQIEAGKNPVTYEVEAKSFKTFKNTTTSNVNIGPLALDKSPGQTHLSMSFNPNGPEAGGTIELLYLECKAESPEWNATVVREGISPAQISWKLPFGTDGPMDAIDFDIVNIDIDTPLKRRIPASELQAKVDLYRRCDPFHLAVRSFFVFDDGSRGPQCTQDSTILPIFIRQPPLSPESLQVDSSTVSESHIDVAWQPSSDLGGCDNLNYTITITKSGSAQALYTRTVFGVDNVTAAIDLPKEVVLEAQQTYEVQVTAATSAGYSKPASAIFVVPAGDHHHGLSKGATAGAVIGAMFAFGIVIAVFFLVMTKKRKREYQSI